MAEPASLLALAVEYGPWGFVLMMAYGIVWALRTGELVLKSQYKLVEDSMNQWKDIALRSIDTTEEGSKALKRVLQTAQDIEQLREFLMNQNQPPPGNTK